ncbi:stage V sporulation protein B [Clostridium sp. JN-9]|uniref:stage V sporulation protein B n=1 Tax=Clostridium sp. JN-9 TaxID=2507159 RepID=UPI000FFE2606|nr:stage V sporulation protein B [Clostridium sp. JN-9]QAT40294.1 stage V sporulation protein B [Clostridium sp. JN-9]
MRKDSFFKDSLILTTSNLTTGVFGFIFSIVLSKELGAEGLGLYGLVMPIYDLFICLICGGMVTAVSKIAAGYFSKRDYGNLNKTIDAALIFDSMWSLFISALVFFNAYYISVYIIKDSRTTEAVKVMCPAMIFIALSSILKGYFYGISKVKIPAIIDICEKACRILIIILIIKIFSVKTLNGTVTAAYVTLTIGELISLILLYIFYIKNRNNKIYNPSKSSDKIQLLFDVIVISFPLCLNGFLTTILSALSALVVPRRLVSAGFNYSTALSMIGKFKGMSSTIIFFPIIVVTSIATILVPDLAKSISKNDYFAMEERIKEVVKIAFTLGIASLAICKSIPNELGIMLYNRNDLGQYISFISWCAPIIYVGSVTYGILNGFGKQKIILRNSLIVSIEEVILLYILTGIPSINIYGYGISMIITGSTILVLNFNEIFKKCNPDFALSNIMVYFLVGLLVYLIIKILVNTMPESLAQLKYIFIIICGFTLTFTFCSLFKIKD